MQLSSVNSLAPPNPGLGLWQEPGVKSSTGDPEDFRSVIGKSQKEGLSPKGLKSKSSSSRGMTRDDEVLSRAEKPVKENSLAQSGYEESVDYSENENSESTLEKSSDSQNGVRKSSRLKEGNLKEGKVSIKNTNNSSGGNSAVQKFMASIENELGISAERFSASLAQLPPSVKALPIETSAPYVIEKLGVPDWQQAEATATYTNLIRASGLGQAPAMTEVDTYNSNPVVPFIQTKEGMPSANLENPALSPELSKAPKLTQRQKLNATIDELNRRFFGVQSKPTSLKNAMSLEEVQGLDPISSRSIEAFEKNEVMELPSYGLSREDFSEHQTPLLDPTFVPPASEWEALPNATTIERTSWLDSSLSPSPPPSPLSPSHLQGRETLSQPLSESWQTANPASLQSMALSDLEKMVLSADGSINSSMKVSGMGESSLTRPKSWTVEELPFLSQQAVEDPQLMSVMDNKDSFSGETEFGFNKSNLNAASKEVSARTSEEKSLDELLQEFQVGPGKNQTSPLAPSSVNQEIERSMAAMTPQQRIDNIEKISSAAESLAARGGGEVKVVLAPEGLGTVQLKVRMEDGKLQVEMKAENKESQRILESSLSDLKHNLASQQISLDSVKVDVGGDFTRRDSAPEFQQPQMDLGRDQARQFMNQFREGNLAQRQTHFEAPGFKTYRTQRDDSLAPISNEIRPRSSLNQNKGRDLNLVA